MTENFHAKLAKFERKIVANPYFRLAALFGSIIGFGVIVATAWQIKMEFDDRDAERQVRRLSRISLAWENLLRRSGGPSGKGEVLSLLFSDGVDISGIDLSCKSVGLFENDECNSRPIFSNVIINNPIDNYIFDDNTVQNYYLIKDIKFLEVAINNFSAFNIKFSNIDFEMTELSNIYIDKSMIIDGNNYNNVICYYCNITNSFVDAELFMRSASGNFSGSTIVGFLEYYENYIVEDDEFPFGGSLKWMDIDNPAIALPMNFDDIIHYTNGTMAPFFGLRWDLTAEQIASLRWYQKIAFCKKLGTHSEYPIADVNFFSFGFDVPEGYECGLERNKILRDIIIPAIKDKY